MKHRLATIVTLLCSLTASAHDFEVDGIYYNVISDTDLMVEVTFKGDDWEYEEYIGAMVVPSTVSYEGKIYRVIGIGDYAFHSCTNITSISIPEGVESIGSLAFCLCISLERVDIPATMISIDESAFNLCERLTTIVVDDENIVYCDGNNNCVVEKNTETLLIGTISGHIPNGIKHLAIAPFSGRKMLEEHINIPDGVISIGGFSFIGSSISSIRIPTSLRSSKSYAFGDVDHSNNTIGTLKSLNVVCIDDLESWFYIDFDYPSSSPLYSAKNLNLNNNRLETISIPEGITIIKPAALAGWNGKKIVIPESTISIGNYAFYDCASLTSIVIPASVSEIGFGAFGGCEGLTSITVNAINPPAIRELTFENVDKSIPVYVPAGSVEAYKAAGGWSKFSNIVSMAVSITHITLSQSSVTLIEGETITLAATVTPDDATDSSVTWSSSAPNVATVDNTGKVTAIAPGSVTITATANDGSGVSASCEVTVQELILGKCATPTINYIDGEFVLTCSTEGAEIKTIVVTENDNEFVGEKFDFLPTHTFTAYATKENYEDSDVATLTICWIPCSEAHESEETSILTIPSKPVLISARDGVLTLSGLAEDTTVTLYTTDGAMVAQQQSSAGEAKFAVDTNQVYIVHIDDKVVKIAM